MELIKEATENNRSLKVTLVRKYIQKLKEIHSKHPSSGTLSLATVSNKTVKDKNWKPKCQNLEIPEIPLTALKNIKDSELVVKDR